MKTYKNLLLPALIAAASFQSTASAADEVNKSFLAFFAPLPAVAESGENPVTDAKVELGRKLYYDSRFSKSQTISCNSCHALDKYGVDGTPNSVGFKGQHGGRNAPTVYHAALHLTQFWDGRLPTVEEQAKGPVLNPIEMAMPDDKTVIAVINSIDEYKTLFAKAFPEDKDAVNYNNFGKAIGAFERKLLTPSRFDDFLKGKDEALTSAEKKGFNTFVSTGCTTCHNGVGIGGNMYQKLGLVKAWDGLKDNGRSDITKNEAEKGFFKVPSLRNIEKTGPYLHDGSVGELTTMVSKMAEHQLGKTLNADEVTSIVAFLKSLTGDLPTDYIAKPTLPPSGPNTPKPSES
jgi:cytochrome c peroxidase